jgi:hypothetical protein
MCPAAIAAERGRLLIIRKRYFVTIRLICPESGEGTALFKRVIPTIYSCPEETSTLSFDIGKYVVL